MNKIKILKLYEVNICIINEGYEAQKETYLKLSEP
jgi:hypothetical protein